MPFDLPQANTTFRSVLGPRAGDDTSARALNRHHGCQVLGVLPIVHIAWVPHAWVPPIRRRVSSGQYDLGRGPKLPDPGLTVFDST
jgi:hypothetical protein